MTWLREMLSDGRTNTLSSTRVVATLAGVTLSLSTLFLTVASFWRIELVPALTVFGGSLAGMAAGNYMTQKIAGSKTNE
jgi:hypothetical protein